MNLLKISMVKIVLIVIQTFVREKKPAIGIFYIFIFRQRELGDLIK